MEEVIDPVFDPEKTPPKVPSKKPWETGMRYGIIGGLISVSLALLTNILGMVNYEVNPDGTTGGSNTLTTVLSIAVFVGVLFIAIREHRDKVLDGRIKFGTAFGVAAMAIVMMTFISSVYTWIFFSFIEPDIIDTMMTQALEQMEDQGQDIEEAEGIIRRFISPAFFAVASFFSGTFMGMLVGLVVSAVLKRD